MMRPPGRWTRRRRRHIRLEPEVDLEPDEDSAVPQPDLDKRRKEYIFGENSRLKPARIGDIKGMPYIVEDINRFISFLKDYRKFRDRGVRVQPGILLHGDPGTGKTLTARVIATESGAKLIDAGGFPRRGRGWTPDDISSLFALAREYHAEDGRPVIIYFDEIDAVCPAERRYRSEASTALMTELDGMGGKPEGIFVVAASNEREDIDGGVLRAGRIGHHIHYDSPGYSGRLEILKFYLGKKPHEPMDVDGLAGIMPDMTPAEIEELIEQAYMDVCLDSPDPKLREADLIGQLLEDVMGWPTGTWATDSERYRACVHEAGHAIVGVKLDYMPKFVAVPKRKYNKGVTLYHSWEEAPTLEQIEREVTATYGGEIAEEIVFGERCIGSTNDVGKATDLSIRLASNWGKKTNYLDVEENRPVIGNNSFLRPLDDGERASIYSEASQIRERCYQRAKEVLEEFGNGGIEHVARQIVEREFLLKTDVGPVVGEARTLNNGTVECRAKTDGGEVDFSLDQSADFAEKRGGLKWRDS